MSTTDRPDSEEAKTAETASEGVGFKRGVLSRFWASSQVWHKVIWFRS